MPISKEKQEKILQKLDQIVKNWKCESCNDESWNMSDLYLPLVLSEKINETEFGNVKILPLVVLTCRKCGHVRLYNLITLGLYNDLIKEKKSNSKEGK